jgi:hypothetical protein
VTSDVLAPPIPLAAALVAHSPHHTTRGKEKGGEEEKREGAGNLKPTPPFECAEGEDANLFFHARRLHCTAT